MTQLWCILEASDRPKRKRRKTEGGFMALHLQEWHVGAQATTFTINATLLFYDSRVLTIVCRPCPWTERLSKWLRFNDMKFNISSSKIKYLLLLLAGEFIGCSNRKFVMKCRFGVDVEVMWVWVGRCDCEMNEIASFWFDVCGSTIWGET